MIEDKTSIRKLSENIKFISTRFETGQKGLPFYPFLKLVQFFLYNGRQCKYIVYLYYKAILNSYFISVLTISSVIYNIIYI